MEKESTLILNARRADEDAEKSCTRLLLQQIDPDQVRTLTVYTLCDVLSSPESQRRLYDWMDKDMSDLAPHACACAVGGQMSKGYQQENDYFKEHLAPLSTNTGSQTLIRDRLPDLLCKLIKTNLPLMRAQMQAKLNGAVDGLGRVGREPKPPSEVCHQICTQFKDWEMHVQALLCAKG